MTAAVTAGVEGNATAAGEPATWRETDDGMQKVPAYAGTINTMLLVNRPLTPAALARVVVTMTEGKSAALHRLAVPSKLHVDLATGTGTDQYCIAAPVVGRAAAHVGESAHEARRAGRARDAQRDARGAALAERPRSQLHARRVSRARPLRRQGGDALRRHRAASRRSGSRAAEKEREGGLLRAARRRGGACAGDGVRSRPVRHDSRSRSPPMRWSSRRRRWRPISRRRSIGGRSSARRCGRTRTAT